MFVIGTTSPEIIRLPPPVHSLSGARPGKLAALRERWPSPLDRVFDSKRGQPVSVRTIKSQISELGRRAAPASSAFAFRLTLCGIPSRSDISARIPANSSSSRIRVEAMGGELEIVTRFPDGDVRIDQFTEDATIS